MLSPTKLLTLMSNKMAWQNEKTHRHSHNIANSETPGFRRVDLKNFREVLKTNVSALRKSESLLSPAMKIDDSHQIQTRDEVKRDVEAMELAQNAVEHQATTQLYKQYLKISKLMVGKT